jgi:hypothetical protein
MLICSADVIQYVVMAFSKHIYFSVIIVTWEFYMLNYIFVLIVLVLRFVHLPFLSNCFQLVVASNIRFQ